MGPTPLHEIEFLKVPPGAIVGPTEFLLGGATYVSVNSVMLIVLFFEGRRAMILSV